MKRIRKNVGVFMLHSRVIGIFLYQLCLLDGRVPSWSSWLSKDLGWDTWTNFPTCPYNIPAGSLTWPSSINKDNEDVPRAPPHSNEDSLHQGFQWTTNERTKEPTWRLLMLPLASTQLSITCCLHVRVWGKNQHQRLRVLWLFFLC